MAELLVSEDFSHPAYVSGDIAGTPARGIGLSGDWELTAQGNILFEDFIPHRADYRAENLSFGSLENSGGSLFLASAGSGGPFVNGARGTLSLAAPIAPASPYMGTLYTAYVWRVNSSPDRMVISLQVDDRYLTFPSLGRFAPAVAYTKNAGASPAETVLVSSALVLGRFTNVGAPLSGANPGTATLWMLNPAQFQHFKAGGLTDNELESATIGNNPDQVSARATQTITSANDNTFQSGDRFISELTIDDNGEDIYSIDAIRYGSSLDVVTPIPEPSISCCLILAVFFGQLLPHRSSSVRTVAV